MTPSKPRQRDEWIVNKVSPSPWNVCVLARTGKHGAVEFIGTAADTLEKLRDNWPRPGRAYRHALDSCQDVIRGWAPSYLARTAFEEVVKEAGLHLHF
ncbi:DUF982 domain-containing protein [Rhizobium viscosum]